jgi:hypothetical protein
MVSKKTPKVRCVAEIWGSNRLEKVISIVFSPKLNMQLIIILSYTSLRD